MRRVAIYSPFTGQVVPLENVPDPVFSTKMMGDGLAIMPETDLAVAPLDGTVTVMHSAGHAFAVQEDPNSLAVLVHIGLDTVKMKGAGFKRLVNLGDRVTVGQPVVRFDQETITRAGYSILSPVILPDLPGDVQVIPGKSTHVSQGVDILFEVILP